MIPYYRNNITPNYVILQDGTVSDKASWQAKNDKEWQDWQNATNGPYAQK